MVPITTCSTWGPTLHHGTIYAIDRGAEGEIAFAYRTHAFKGAPKAAAVWRQTGSVPPASSVRLQPLATIITSEAEVTADSRQQAMQIATTLAPEAAASIGGSGAAWRQPASQCG